MGEKVTSASQEAIKSAAAMEARNMLAVPGRARRRKKKLPAVPAMRARATIKSGQRKKDMAEKLRSRKWPKERAYSPGCWERTEEMSGVEPWGPGGGAGARRTRKRQKRAATDPAMRRKREMRRPARSMAAPVGEAAT